MEVLPISSLQAIVGILELGKYTYIFRKHSRLDLLKPEETAKNDITDSINDDNASDKEQSTCVVWVYIGNLY